MALLNITETILTAISRWPQEQRPQWKPSSSTKESSSRWVHAFDTTATVDTDSEYGGAVTMGVMLKLTAVADRITIQFLMHTKFM